MSKVYIPEGYQSSLDIRGTEKAIKKVKDYFYVIQRPKEEAVAGNLHFRRSTPCHAKREIFFDKYKEKGISEQTLQTIDTLDTWKEKVKRLVGPEITAKIIKLLKR